MARITLVLALACCMCLSVPAHSDATSKWLVIFDLTQPAGVKEFSGNRVFSCSSDDAGTLKDSVSSAVNLQNALKNYVDLKASLQKCDDRWISSIGDQLDIYVISDGDSTTKVSVDEKSRKSQIATDLSTLLKVIEQIRTGVTAPPPKVEHTTYLLTKKRASLTVSASIEAPSSIVGSAAAPASPLKAEIITGPEEHWFLSADLPVNSVNQIKYDDVSGKIVEKNTPNHFYLGADFKLGDIFKSYSGAKLWKGIVLKAIVLAQKDPLESYGVAVAYRGKPGSFSPFVGWTFTQTDVKGSDGTIKKNDKRESKFRVGLSYNLDQALTWFKK